MEMKTPRKIICLMTGWMALMLMNMKVTNLHIAWADWIRLVVNLEWLNRLLIYSHKVSKLNCHIILKLWAFQEWAKSNLFGTKEWKDLKKFSKITFKKWQLNLIWKLRNIQIPETSLSPITISLCNFWHKFKENLMGQLKTLENKDPTGNKKGQTLPG